VPKIITRDFPSAPLCAEPWLPWVFFNGRRTLSGEIVSMTAHFTSLSAILCKVQRPYPSGGALPAILVTCASTLGSIFLGRPRRGASWSTSRMGAGSLCRYFLRTVYLVPRELPHIVVSSFSDLSASKSHQRRALLMARALCLPWATHFAKRARSSAVHRTSGCFLGILLSSLQRRVYRKPPL
jgi:hypothetical protein